MNNNTKFNDEIFKIPFDKVKLPSEGKLYTNIPDTLDVEYMVTSDEDILYSNNLMDNGLVFNKLIEKKLLDKSINVNDLLLGDFNQLLVFLRISGYGHLYKTKAFDPDEKDYVDQVVDLKQLKVVGIGAEFDENGEFSYTLPVLNKRITFKLLTVGLGDYINNTANAKKVGNVIPYITTKLETQIMSVEGERDKLYISNFVKIIPPIDRLTFSNYVDSIEPKVDLTCKFFSSTKRTEYEEKVILGIDFFYPQSI